MPYSNLVFIAMNRIKFMDKRWRTRMIRFTDHLNESSFYSIVHCPLLCSPEFANQETLSVVLTVTSTWMFLNITYNGSWDICNVKFKSIQITTTHGTPTTTMTTKVSWIFINGIFWTIIRIHGTFNNSLNHSTNSTLYIHLWSTTLQWLF